MSYWIPVLWGQSRAVQGRQLGTIVHECQEVEKSFGPWAQNLEVLRAQRGSLSINRGYTV